ncbi:MAG: hypothetical protein GY839_18365 [candidate division Zixibacteria bacterium]|nr:hypothetical protein [candidate division Zixibacteria bacterium]
MTLSNKSLLIIMLVFAMSFAIKAQSTDDCLMCHEDPDLTTDRDGHEISVFVDLDKYQKSIHGEFECIDCHASLEDAEFPHEERIEAVDCGLCHDDIAEIHAKSVHGKSIAGEATTAAECKDCHGIHDIVSPSDKTVGLESIKCGVCHGLEVKQFNESLHGQAVKKKARLAPRCWDCHGAHDIVESTSPDSRVAKLKIPFMCGRCHKEGTPVTRTYDIHQDSIIFHYSLSIHGVGLYNQGLTVTAVCNDCHTSHHVLPHTDSRSSIYRDNVPGTCQKCHGLIEEVHRKVIKGELWEKEPHKVPVCVDCHSPHKIRRVYYEQGVADKDCLKCHSNPDITMRRDGQAVSLYIDTLEVHDSIHRNTSCSKCHTGANPGHSRPCSTIKTSVDCSICHAEVVLTYNNSTHGILADRGDPNAPLCIECHGKHNIKGHRDSKSPTFPTNIPVLCGQCHREGSEAAVRYEGDQHEIVQNYTMSIHGKGLLESGLVVTAMCTDCHTAHNVLPHDNPLSSIHGDNISQTCANCHMGIYEQYAQSIHFPGVADTDEQLPGCHDCHSSHQISRTDLAGFKTEIIATCGRCHEGVTETYFDTFHGKVSKLGYTAAAKCYDCHGAHNVLPVWDTKSTLHRDNIVETCGQCHEGSHRRFAGYLTHATHHDREKYPALYYTFWFMTILLVGTFGLVGIHTLLWLPRSFQTMKRNKQLKIEPRGKEFVRFKPLYRRLHVMVIVSFLGLAVTGMTLKFSYLGWAQWISDMLGGFESAGYIHRMCAIITFAYFFRHIFDMIVTKRKQKVSWRKYIFNPGSMLPNMTDVREYYQTVKWFIGLGPRPKYGRWTYWEKFDYFAVFWGVAIIGSTGLILWFPEFFTRFLPGWFVNVATIVHSDEALLATGFIFTVHFFNTHFRPDKFPMDTVIFTGRVPLEELKEDRPREYEELIKSGELDKHMKEPLPDYVVNSLKIFGACALFIGLTLIVLIIYAEVFGYR